MSQKPSTQLYINPRSLDHEASVLPLCCHCCLSNHFILVHEIQDASAHLILKASNEMSKLNNGEFGHLAMVRIIILKTFLCVCWHEPLQQSCKRCLADLGRRAEIKLQTVCSLSRNSWDRPIRDSCHRTGRWPASPTSPSRPTLPAAASGSTAASASRPLTERGWWIRHPTKATQGSKPTCPCPRPRLATSGAVLCQAN